MRFDSDANLTRAQIARNLNLAAGVLGIDTSDYSHSLYEVADYLVDIQRGCAVVMYIIEVRGGSPFDHDTAVNDQGAIAVIYLALNALGKEEHGISLLRNLMNKQAMRSPQDKPAHYIPRRQ